MRCRGTHTGNRATRGTIGATKSTLGDTPLTRRGRGTHTGHRATRGTIRATKSTLGNPPLTRRGRGTHTDHRATRGTIGTTKSTLGHATLSCGSVARAAQSPLRRAALSPRGRARCNGSAATALPIGARTLWGRRPMPVAGSRVGLTGGRTLVARRGGRLARGGTPAFRHRSDVGGIGAAGKWSQGRRPSRLTGAGKSLRPHRPSRPTGAGNSSRPRHQSHPTGAGAASRESPRKRCCQEGRASRSSVAHTRARVASMLRGIED